MSPLGGTDRWTQALGVRYQSQTSLFRRRSPRQLGRADRCPGVSCPSKHRELGPLENRSRHPQRPRESGQIANSQWLRSAPPHPPSPTWTSWLFVWGGWALGPRGRSGDWKVAEHSSGSLTVSATGDGGVRPGRAQEGACSCPGEPLCAEPECGEEGTEDAAGPWLERVRTFSL